MILIMGGTTESILFANKLKMKGFDVVLSTASDYGQHLARKGFDGRIISGKRDEGELILLCRDMGVEALVDMSHPYATEVSKNSIQAAKGLNIPYYRYERPETLKPEALRQNIEYFDSYEEAGAWLNRRQGNILVTTGSKFAEKWVAAIEDIRRLHIRFLPDGEQIEIMEGLGLKPDQLLAMKGPFSAEMNLAMLHHIEGKFLITKESGDAGKVDEKLSAAQQAGATIIMIRRPVIDYPNRYSDMEGLLEQIQADNAREKNENSHHHPDTGGSGYGKTAAGPLS